MLTISNIEEIIFIFLVIALFKIGNVPQIKFNLPSEKEDKVPVMNSKRSFEFRKISKINLNLFLVLQTLKINEFLFYCVVQSCSIQIH